MSSDPPFGPRFLVKRRLGSGGFGDVYEVFDKERDVWVALKWLHRMEPSSLYKFKQEFRTLVDLSHPNLLCLHEFFVEGADEQKSGRRWFFTMELVPGTDAKTYVSKDEGQKSQVALAETRPITPLVGLAESSGENLGEEPTLQGDPPKERRFADVVDEHRLRSVLRQLASGLCFLHDAGHLHRDIKPGNLRVTEAGRLVLLDFGLVSHLSGSAGSNDSIVGTPDFMSPEQASSSKLDEKSDWYSVGVFLYDVLCGELPFSGAWLRVLSSKLEREAPSPARFCTGIPEDLLALCRDLLRRDPHSRPTGREVLSRLGGRVTPTPMLHSSARHVAVPALRLAAVGTLCSALRQVSEEGKGGVALLHGQAGMGKSTLLRLLSEQSGAVVLHGKCYPQESMPFKALDGVIDSLSRYLRRLPVHEAQGLLGKDVRALCKLFPVLLSVDAVRLLKRQEIPLSEPQQELGRASRALREILGRIADQKPLLLCIDDAHFGDLDSAMLLGEVLRGPSQPTLLCVLAYRTEEAEQSPFLRSLRSQTGETALEIPLLPLSPEESTSLALDLLRSRLPKGQKPEALDKTATEIALSARGDPATLEELVSYASDVWGDSSQSPVPVLRDSRGQGSLLAAALGSRVQRLPEPAQRMLSVLVVSGQPLPQRLVPILAKIPTAEAPQALSSLRITRLIRSRSTHVGEVLEVYSPRIGEILLQELPPNERVVIHRLLAEAYAGHSLGTEAQGELANDEAAAAHYLAAGEPALAAPHAKAAAAQAEAALAFDRAARLYRLALPYVSNDGPASFSIHIKERLAEALRQAGRGKEAAEIYLELAESPTCEPVLALDLRRRAAEQLLHSGHTSAGLLVLRGLHGALLLPFPTSLFSIVLRLLWFRFYLLWLLFRLRGFPLQKAGPPSREMELRLHTCWAASSGLGNQDTVRGAYFGTLHLILALRMGEPKSAVRALAQFQSFVALSGGEKPSLMERRAEAALIELQNRSGIQDPYSLAVVELFRGITGILRGHWQKALAHLEQAIAGFSTHCKGVMWELSSAQHFALLCLGILGRWRELLLTAPQVLAYAQKRGDRYTEATVRARVGHFQALALNQPEEARRQVQEARAYCQEQGHPMQEYLGLVAEIEVALYAGRGVTKEALEVVKTRWPALRKSYLLSVQSIRGDAEIQRANAYMAAAACETEACVRRAYLREAEGICRRLHRDKMGWIEAKVSLVRAALVNEGNRGRKGGEERVVAHLEAAERGFAEAGMAFHAAAARYRRGLLQKDRELCREAAGVFVAQGITAPERLVELLSPGWTSE